MKTHARGFSMVELLVSVLIGMLALVFVMRSSVDFEKNRRSGIGGSDSMQNGVIALFSMENDAAQAGWGLNDVYLSGCPARFFDTQNYADANVAGGVALTLAPVSVVFNGANSDSISFMSGTSDAGSGAVGLAITPPAGPTTSLNIDVEAKFFAPGDVLAIANPVPTAAPLLGVQGGPCAIAQVASLPGGPAGLVISIANDGTLNTRFNPPAGLLAPGAFAGGQTKIYNLGKGASLGFHTWDVNNGVLRLRATDLSGASNAPVSAVSGIVAIKALYGIDTRPAPPAGTPIPPCIPALFMPDCGLQISQWSAAMIDANADGTINSLDNQRIGFLRLAVVARSRQIEKLTPGHTTCTDTIPANAVQPTVFSALEPAGIATVPIAVNVAVAGDAIDWTCYHYRVFETIVPLRNIGWKPA